MPCREKLSGKIVQLVTFLGVISQLMRLASSYLCFSLRIDALASDSDDAANRYVTITSPYLLNFCPALPNLCTQLNTVRALHPFGGQLLCCAAVFGMEPELKTVPTTTKPLN